MFASLIVSGALTLSMGVKPPDYTDRSLCDLWAGAQCQVAKCDGASADAKCKAESKKCKHLTGEAVSKEKAAKVAECAKQMLKQTCGQPAPAECAGVEAP